MDESIQDGLKNLSRGIKTLENGLMKDKIIDENSEPADVIKELQGIEKKITKSKENNDQLAKVHKLMGITPSTNKELVDLDAKFNDRKLLWTHVDKFIKLQELW